MTSVTTRRIILPIWPKGRLDLSDFRLEDMPLDDLAAGEVAVATRWLAIDPGVILRLTANAPFAPPYQPGEVVPGYGTGIVTATRHPGFAVGDTVTGPLGWRDLAHVNGALLERWTFTDLPEITSLTAMGVPGLTGYFGVALGQVEEGETVVISSAAGSVGMCAAQIAKLRGARVVGVAGGPVKCAWLETQLGLDAAIDYKTEKDLVAALRVACPRGVDMYLDLVGGDLLNTVVAVASPGARIILCGALSEFDAPAGVHHGLRHLTWIIQKGLRLEGFTLPRFASLFPEAKKELAGWLTSGELRTREEIFDGLGLAPAALLGLFRGESFGRRLVRVAEDSIL